MTAAMLSMFAGAQAVHIIYNPLQDLDQYVEEEKRKLGLLRLKNNTDHHSKTQK